MDVAAIAGLPGGERSGLSDIKHIPLTDPVIVTPHNQIEMDVTIMVGIGTITQYGRKTSTSTAVTSRAATWRRCHGAAQYRRGGKIDSMIVWQGHRTQFDHIRCGA